MLDARCAYGEYIVKTQDKEGEIAFYAVADNVDQQMFGGVNCNKVAD